MRVWLLLFLALEPVIAQTSQTKLTPQSADILNQAVQKIQFTQQIQKGSAFFRCSTFAICCAIFLVCMAFLVITMSRFKSLSNSPKPAARATLDIMMMATRLFVGQFAVASLMMAFFSFPVCYSPDDF
eukprot:c5547_g1_i2.p1 GENE.c5547_g1_i2~~c5547_g1_i2.p1  ORF type:complete len:143 (+),score=17.89 c5547_g1_i2:46-429(+)